MKKNKVVGFIPARYDSTRIPGKPLYDIYGKPLIQHVWDDVSQVNILDDLVVAVDDKRVYDCVDNFGGKAVMTPNDIPTGSDRIGFVIDNYQEYSDCDIAVDIHCDILGLFPPIIEKVVHPLLDHEDFGVSILKKKLEPNDDPINPNITKVITDLNNRLIFCSRSVLPNKEKSNISVDYYKMLGIVAYKKQVLLDFLSWERTPLEIAEDGERLRFVEHGIPIYVSEVTCLTIEIETPDDIARIPDWYAD